MKSILDFLKTTGSLHHAYLIEGQYAEILLEVQKYLEESGVVILGNPDVWVEQFVVFLIGDAARIRSEHGKRSMSGKKFFLLGIESATTDAQNALLKTLEEPQAGTHFFILTPRLSAFLPTLRSRFIEVKAVDHRDGVDVSGFLASSASKRL